MRCRELGLLVAALEELLGLCLHAVQLLIVLGENFLESSLRRPTSFDLIVHVACIRSFVAELFVVVTSFISLFKPCFHIFAEIPYIRIHPDQLFHNGCLL